MGGGVIGLMTLGLDLGVGLPVGEAGLGLGADPPVGGGAGGAVVLPVGEGGLPVGEIGLSWGMAASLGSAGVW